MQTEKQMDSLPCSVVCREDVQCLVTNQPKSWLQIPSLNINSRFKHLFEQQQLAFLERSAKWHTPTAPSYQMQLQTSPNEKLQKSHQSAHSTADVRNQYSNALHLGDILDGITKIFVML